MIAIRESLIDVKKVETMHSDFVSRRIEKVLDFYIALFSLFEQLRKMPNTKGVEISRRLEVIAAATGPGETKSLINAILKKKYAIRKAKDFPTVRHADRRLFPANKVVKITNELKLLKKHFRRLVDFDVSTDKTAHHKYYLFCQGAFQNIEMVLWKIFDYNWFLTLDPNSQWGPYQLTRAIGINTCPYCNRAFIYTIVRQGGKKIARPQLDHFLSKSHHPLLALSFYNLIPCCSVCNSSIKGNENITFRNLLNPYANNPAHSVIRFSYYPKDFESSTGLRSNLDVFVKYDGPASNRKLRLKVENHIRLFCLNEVYAYHKDIVQEILWKKSKSSGKYVEMLQNALPGLKVTYSDAYRQAYGNYYDEIDFHKRPLSKLVKDIVASANKSITP